MKRQYIGTQDLSNEERAATIAKHLTMSNKKMLQVLLAGILDHEPSADEFELFESGFLIGVQTLSIEMLNSVPVN